MASTVKKDRRWFRGIVPYAFDFFDFPDPGTNQNIRDGIKQAIDEWNNHGLKVKFQKRTLEPSFLLFKVNHFTSSGGSNSGMSHGIQIVWAPNHNNAAKTKATMLHELGHALGLCHEVCRHDRGNYVDIDFSNIEHVPLTRYYENQFEINSDARNHGAYDFASIMHYDSYAYAKDNSKPVIRKKDGSTVSASQVLSSGDVDAIRDLYSDIDDPRTLVWNGLADIERALGLPSIDIVPPTLQITPPSVTVDPPPLTIQPPPITVAPPPVTITPPKIHVSPPSIRVFGKNYSVPSFDVQPGSVTISPPSITVTPPAVTVDPPPVTVAPPPITANPPAIHFELPKIQL